MSKNIPKVLHKNSINSKARRFAVLGQFKRKSRTFFRDVNER
jgi:hypothetical protein